MKRPILILVTVLMLASLACSINVDLPASAKTGETRTLEINEPSPDVKPSELVLRMGGGTLTLSGGSSRLAEGTIRYNVEEWTPEVVREGRQVIIRQQNLARSLPFNDDIVNDWELKLSKDPLDLTIEAGAYEGELDMTGVPLVRLKVSDGAGTSTLTFDEPNPVHMDTLTYETGASNVSLEKLGNSDAEVINFRGGAGNFALDFSGELQRDMRVYVDGGLGNITIQVPANSNTRILLSTSLNTISTSGAWTVIDNEYRTNGEGPALRIEVKVGIGNLNLINK